MAKILIEAQPPKPPQSAEPAKPVLTDEAIEKTMKWKFGGTIITNKDSEWVANERRKEAVAFLSSLPFKSEAQVRKEQIKECIQTFEHPLEITILIALAVGVVLSWILGAKFEHWYWKPKHWRRFK